MRILLIDSDEATSTDTENLLTTEGHVCDVVDRGEEALQIVRLYDYNVIVLNFGLPDIDGYEMLRRLRNTQVRAPILVLSDHSDPDVRINTLILGADDYMLKPYHQRELIVRLQALVRRSMGYSQSVIRTGKLSLNLDAQEVRVGDTPVYLTSKEYGALELLVMRKGMAVTKEMFMDHLYGGIDEPNVKIIDVFICKLRKKLKALCDGTDYIQTIWGRGYVWRAPELDLPTAQPQPQEKVSQVA